MQGELKRKMERMIRRFLNKHTVASTGDDEHMSFAVALTVMRIQRHWRNLVATRAQRAAAAAEVAAAEAAAAEAVAQQAQQLGEQDGSPAPGAAAAAGKGVAKAPSNLRRLLSRLSSKASSTPTASAVVHWTEER